MARLTSRRLAEWRALLACSEDRVQGRECRVGRAPQVVRCLVGGQIPGMEWRQCLCRGRRGDSTIRLSPITQDGILSTPWV